MREYKDVQNITKTGGKKLALEVQLNVKKGMSIRGLNVGLARRCSEPCDGY